MAVLCKIGLPWARAKEVLGRHKFADPWKTFNPRHIYRDLEEHYIGRDQANSRIPHQRQKMTGGSPVYIPKPVVMIARGARASSAPATSAGRATRERQVIFASCIVYACTSIRENGLLLVSVHSVHCNSALCFLVFFSFSIGSTLLFNA